MKITLFETLGLCECLIALIQFEVKQGNKISGYDTHAKWPKEESHLIYLKQSLHLKNLNFPQRPNVQAQVNRDMHSNWHTDASPRTSSPYYWIIYEKNKK